jgi:serine/threonine protein kinase
MTVEIGSRLGPYEILAQLGAGGMGEVFRATDTRLLRDVAVKILPSDFAKDEERMRRFEQEARLQGALSHPNILTIYDVGLQDQIAYFVIELLEGESLRALLQREQLSTGSAVHYAVQISSGLAAAHERGIIHRDLKPENVFVTRDGIVKILDFGLAKLTKDEPHPTASQLPTTPHTDPGMLLGTVAYMSPEQVRTHEVDGRSDIFSFGVLLYEMLAGKRPFAGETSADLMSAILRDEADYDELKNKVPAELLHVLAHCLEKNPANRFQSARDLTFSLRMIEANLFLQISKEHVKPKADAFAHSIAVLPFIDMSPQKDHEYFCDGLAEELITALTKIQDLRVASRTSAFQYKKHQADIREIGRQLNVETILDGSVRKSGNRLRITAELINTADGYHLWSERYDRDMEDIFFIQDEMARTIVQTLHLKLVGAADQGLEKDIRESYDRLDQLFPKLVRRYTDNIEAYNLYLKGRHFWKFRTHAGLNKSIEYFQQAIDKDPNYALAHAGIADAFSTLGFYTFIPPLEAYPKAMEAAEKALQIDPLLPEGHLSLGAALLYFDADWIRGEKAMKRALELNPQFAFGYCWYSGFLTWGGRHDEAAKAIQKAQELDPLNPLYSSFAGMHYYGDRRYDQALQELNKALEIEPQFLLAVWFSGMAFMNKEMPEHSINFFKRAVDISKGSTFFIAYLGMAYGKFGFHHLAEELLAQLKERSVTEYVAPLNFARIYLGLNQMDRFFDELEKAYHEKNVLLYLPYSPEFDSIRSDPRYTAIMKKLAPSAQ